ncbi:MAG: heme exporter protein CcmD [Gammaproteobacteria bacterium]|nr:heme exporter protein CcmD [Gammaproteobacteria bacterium]MDH4256208.1 heme exporter protein CcmD [Gammaproteobacteria bacterium]MDH5311773.1 heme exporter protein CcmD [Gammaproteobacteria bacterium]
MTEMFAMGNYGAYVWSSFGLTAIVMLACVAQARSRQRTVYQQIETRLKAMESAE